MNKIAIYLRLSEEDYHKVDESVSIVNQRDYIKSYIANETSLKSCEIEEYVEGSSIIFSPSVELVSIYVTMIIPISHS